MNLSLSAVRSRDRAKDEFLKNLPEIVELEPKDFAIAAAFEAGYCAGYAQGAVDATKRESVEEPS